MSLVCLQLGCWDILLYNYVICCLDIHVHITKEVHLLAEVVVPGSSGDGGFLTEGYSW